MTFLNLALLAGLIAVLIPPIIHLLNRRKYDTVDWAAMQFLQVSQRTRRKIFLEELLLMAMRMGLIAVLVLALAAPVVSSDLFTWMKSLLGTRSTRDVALVFDGSASMGYRHEGKTAAAAAAEWAGKFLDELAPGDGVGVVQARPVPVPVLPALLPDRRQVRAALEGLPEPAGSPDTPSALNAALQILSESKLPRRELVVLTDNQRHGWADERTLERWELLTGKLRAEGAEVPRVWVVNVAGGRPADPPNAALAPVTASRAVAVVGREVRFQGAVQLSGEGVRAPREVRVEIDERPAGSEPILSGASSGQVPFRFTRRFATPGSHLVTLRIPDDAMPGDNRQDFALEVVRAIPVLLVDGDPRSAVQERGSDFLRDALAPARDPSPAFQVKAVPVSEFVPGMLFQPVGQAAGNEPRLLILANVARLTPEQQQGVERFLNQGGGVLVTLGERADAEFYNAELFRGGQGWMPAELVEPIGELAEVEKAARPQPESFAHPALELFREPLPGGLATAHFPRHWKLRVPEGSPGTAIGMFSDREPFLVERAFGKGSVIVAAVAMDNSWRTNLTTLPDFPRLAHELSYYLAGTRGSRVNLDPGQPIVFRPTGDEPPGPVRVEEPDGTVRQVAAEAWPAVVEQTRLTGVYKVTSDGGETRYYVVRPDAAESVLTPCTEEDREKVAGYFPDLRYVTDVDQVMQELNRADRDQEFWPLFMLLVIVLLCGEIWLTRRMAMRGQAAG